MYDNFGWLTNIGTMRSELEKLLDHWSSAKPPKVIFSRGAWEPAVDICETENELTVVAELAGTNEDIEIVIDSNTLVIRGTREEVCCGYRRLYHQLEIATGPFERGLQLPIPVDPDGAQISYEDGLLRITLPKRQEIQYHKVSIKARSR